MCVANGKIFMDKLNIITIGEVLVELSNNQSLEYADTLDKYFGGDTIASAVAVSRLGGKVGYITKVASDAFRDFLTGGLVSEGIDITTVTTNEGYNGIYFVAGCETGKREFAYYRKKSAASTVTEKDIDEEYIKKADIVYATGITQSLSLSVKEAVHKMYSIAKENGITTAYAPNFYSVFWSKEEAREAFEDIKDYIDIIFINLFYDANELWEIESYDKIKDMLFDVGIKTVIIKSKEHSGYFVYSGNEKSFVPFYSNIKIDTTGAGDVFLYEISKGSSPFKAAETAAVVSGLQVRKIGAIKSIPTLKEVTAAIQEKNEQQ